MKKIILYIIVSMVSLALSSCELSTETLSIHSNKTLLVTGNDFVLYLKDNQLYSWGSNSEGQLGIGSESISVIEKTEIDLQLYEDEYVASIHAGYDHAAVLTSTGRVLMWGNNAYQQVTDSGHSKEMTPVDITAQLPLDEEEYVTQVELGSFHTGIVTSKNKIIVFGLNTSGQLGLGFSSMSESYQVIPFEATHHILLSFGSEHSSLIDGSEVYMWGSNFNGQLGLGDVPNQYQPTQLESLTFDNDELINISLGPGITIIHTNKGNMYGFGKSVYGIIGTQTEKDIFYPTAMSFFDLNEAHWITEISFGYSHATFKTSKDLFFNLGYNSLSQLGFGPAMITDPINMSQLPVFKNAVLSHVSNGGYFQVVIVDNQLKATGYSENGALGTAIQRNTWETIHQ